MESSGRQLPCPWSPPLPREVHARGHAIVNYTATRVDRARCAARDLNGCRGLVARNCYVVDPQYLVAAIYAHVLADVVQRREIDLSHERELIVVVAGGADDA